MEAIRIPPPRLPQQPLATPVLVVTTEQSRPAPVKDIEQEQVLMVEEAAGEDADGKYTKIDAGDAGLVK